MLANYNTKERALALQAAYEERAIIAIKKYGDAYEKVRAFGDIYGESHRFPDYMIVKIINSDKCNELINKNDIYEDKGAQGDSKEANANRRYSFIKNIFRDERSKYYQEQLEIARTEALNAMKKANLFDKLFVEFSKYD